MIINKVFPNLQITSLEGARELDVEFFDGIISIEDSITKDPFRVEQGYPKQLVLQFDDILTPFQQHILPNKTHISRILQFCCELSGASVLIHCHAGMSRSPAAALAILADYFGVGNEDRAVRELLNLSPSCTPNKLMVKIIDEVLELNGCLVSTLEKKLSSIL